MKSLFVWIGVAVIISVTLLILMRIFAGAAGVLLGIPVLIVGWIRFASYMGIFNLPDTVRSITGWVMGIGIISILVIGISDLTIIKDEKKTTAGIEAFITKDGNLVTRVTRIVTVKKAEWTKINLEPNHWFQIVPQDKIRVKLLDKREFIQEPGKKYPRPLKSDGTLGEEESFGDIIPGFIIMARAEDADKAEIVFSTWPKK